MYIRLTLASLATLIGLGGTAHAPPILVYDIFAAGPAYGGYPSIGGSVTCRIFNVAGSTVSIISRKIYDNLGREVALTLDSCYALEPTKTCAYTAQPTGNLAYSCRIFASIPYTGTGANVSGVVEIQSPNHTVLATVPLRK